MVEILILILISMGCMKEPIEKVRYKCKFCFNFNLCENCYIKRNDMVFQGNSSHKNYHEFNEFLL